MKFKLSNIANVVTVGDEAYEKFKEYGFTFKKGYCKGDVIVEKKEVEIQSIEELMAIINYFDCEVIVGTDNITIYDGYNE